jgi:beta-xylosidase
VLAAAVKSGKVSEAQLDEFARRVLRDKVVLGLFENPYVRDDPIEIRKVAAEGVDLSRRLAAESVTLLKNENGILPLSRDVKKVAVIGPHADTTMVGFPQYTYPAAIPMLRVAIKLGAFPMPGVGTVPPEGMEGLKADLASADADVEQYARKHYGAVSLSDAIRKLLPDAEVKAVAVSGVLPSQPVGISAAVAAAKNADAVILYIGGKGGWYGDDLTEKEGGDTADIDLPPQQVDLVNAVVASGKPTVAVVSMGVPRVSRRSSKNCRRCSRSITADRIRALCLPRPIFGVTNPGGKLPITLPRHVGQVPIHHGQKWGSGYRRTKTDIHAGYLDMPSTPLFPFGHGLSYTSFEFGPLKLDSDNVDVGGELRASLTVTNKGQRRGTEIVQLYAAASGGAPCWAAVDCAEAVPPNGEADRPTAAAPAALRESRLVNPLSEDFMLASFKRRWQRRETRAPHL